MPSETKMSRRYRNQAPDERFDAFGEASLSDAELLAILLRCGTTSSDALATAHRLLLENDNSLAVLMRKTASQLQTLPGIGPVKARQLRSLCELSKRIWATRRPEGLCLDSPAAVADHFMELLRHEETEQLHAVFFDSQLRMISERCLSRGDSRYTLFSAREVIGHALACRAGSVVLVHNHPGGDPHPSREDVSVTNSLAEACALMDLKLEDHIIIGDGSYYSFLQAGELQRQTAKAKAAPSC